MLGLILLASVAPANDPDALRALAGVFEENRARFDKGIIYFEYIDGFSAAPDEAARGVITGSYRAEGSYCFEGDNLSYSCLFPAEAMVAATRKAPGGATSNRLKCVRLLTDGKLTLSEKIAVGPDGKLARGTIIAPGTEEFCKLAEVPLNLGLPDGARNDLARVARMILDRTSGMSLEEVEDGVMVEGVRTIRLEMKSPGGTRQVWVDPERGAIPIRTHDELTGGGTYDLHHGDIRLVPGRGWFPFEWTLFLPGGRAKRVLVTKADFGLVPRDAFRMEFPEPIPMLNLAESVTYRPRKVWDLARLPHATSPDASRVAAAVPEPVMPGEREPRPPYYTLGAVGLSVAVVIAGAYRWRKKASPT